MADAKAATAEYFETTAHVTSTIREAVRLEPRVVCSGAHAQSATTWQLQGKAGDAVVYISLAFDGQGHVMCYRIKVIRGQDEAYKTTWVSADSPTTVDKVLANLQAALDEITADALSELEPRLQARSDIVVGV